MKVLTIIGARPQFIKAAAVSRAFKNFEGELSEVLVHTGQHYDANMSEIFFEELSIPHPQYNLGIGGGTHGQNTGRMIEKIEEVLLKEKPDFTLVYGDTDSTLAGAIASSKLHIPLAHVEAGLRSFNRRMPEEINRVLTDHVADLLFAPTQTAVKNLKIEGILENSIQLVGDVMFDASLFYRAQSRRPVLNTGIEKGYALCTIHRAENCDQIEKLKEILEGLASLPSQILLPLHPRTKAKIAEHNLSVALNITLLPPVSYLEMIWLEMNSAVIITDSGGVQKEAFFFKKPCITLRNETEWVELVEIGANILVGHSPAALREAFFNFMNAQFLFPQQELYGDGASAQRIAETIKSCAK
ncbi:non-hydrolyzing UDP-N-acetylglucosamine 2-epimerase [Pigmentiphaga sp. D-2]|uniref:non-hydrolyzing UDP-N-acetylglucosamine 2-epimerase n=1 Tax=Pigmentiphaga sp. D-2 TaxID=1002116 RepID=UPI001042B7D5|nr:UDP-N-acetylglucosamine 2-epimerase (non-hydrolyzing) [Pigmentiphaga sp. D-2]